MLTKYCSADVIEVRRGNKEGDPKHRLSSFEHLPKETFQEGDDYLYVKVRAISSRVNKNYDSWPAYELAGMDERHFAKLVMDLDKEDSNKESSSSGPVRVFTSNSLETRDGYGFKTFSGRPVFVDHHNSDPNRARGVVVDAVLHVEPSNKKESSGGYWSSPEAESYHKPETWIELLLEIDARSFPKLAAALESGEIDSVSMGASVQNTECNICGNIAETQDDFCNHIANKGNVFFSQRDGKKKVAAEICHDVTFFEISNVFDPADPTAVTTEPVKPRKVKRAKTANLGYPSKQNSKPEWVTPAWYSDRGPEYYRGSKNLRGKRRKSGSNEWEPQVTPEQKNRWLGAAYYAWPFVDSGDRERVIEIVRPAWDEIGEKLRRVEERADALKEMDYHEFMANEAEFSQEESHLEDVAWELIKFQNVIQPLVEMYNPRNTKQYVLEQLSLYFPDEWDSFADVSMDREERPERQVSEIREKYNVGERDERGRLKWTKVAARLDKSNPLSTHEGSSRLKWSSLMSKSDIEVAMSDYLVLWWEQLERGEVDRANKTIKAWRSLASDLMSEYLVKLTDELTAPGDRSGRDEGDTLRYLANISDKIISRAEWITNNLESDDVSYMSNILLKSADEALPTGVNTLADMFERNEISGEIGTPREQESFDSYGLKWENGYLIDKNNDFKVKPVDRGDYATERVWGEDSGDPWDALREVAPEFVSLVSEEYDMWKVRGDITVPPKEGRHKITFTYNGYVRKVPKDREGLEAIREEMDFINSEMSALNAVPPARSYMDNDVVMVQEELTDMGQHKDNPASWEMEWVDIPQAGYDAGGQLRAFDAFASKKAKRLKWSQVKTSDYNGWTNWDTWNTVLIAENEYESYKRAHSFAEKNDFDGLKQFLIEDVIGPTNAEVIKSAQEWNDIPEEERIDYAFEDLKERSPKAAELVDALGFGANVSDVNPDIIDVGLVNFEEIWDHLRSQYVEDTEPEDDLFVPREWTSSKRSSSSIKNAKAFDKALEILDSSLTGQNKKGKVSVIMKHAAPQVHKDNQELLEDFDKTRNPLSAALIIDSIARRKNV